MARNSLSTIQSQFSDLKKEMREDYASPRADYAAGKSNRFRRLRNGLYGSADSHYANNELEFIRVREYVRDMERNDATSLIGHVVNVVVANSIQQGFTFEPKTGDDKINADLKARWHDWSTDRDECDIAGERTFWDFEKDTLHQTIIDGDVIHLGTEEGALQTFEAHRLRCPGVRQIRGRNIVAGIELDDQRRRVNYFFAKDNIDPLRRIDSAADMLAPIAARDSDGERQVFHVYNPTRFTQTRGITHFHAAFDLGGMIEDVSFAAVVKQQVATCIAAFFEQTGIPIPGGDPTKFGGERQQVQNVDGTSAFEEGISPGMIKKVPPGFKLSAFTPNIPGENFIEHMKFLMMILCVQVNLPLVMALMDAKETNFSGYRGAVDQARLMFDTNRKGLKTQFHHEVSKWKVRQWMAEDPALRAAQGRAIAGGGTINLFRHHWAAPGWKYIEPFKDARADAFRVDNLLTSPTRLQAERGQDYIDIVTESVRDQKFAILAAIKASAEIEAEVKVKVDWREILHRDLPRGEVLQAVEDEGDSGTSTSAKTKTKKKPAKAAVK